jgi:two-component system, sensor histidine kinase
MPHSATPFVAKNARTKPTAGGWLLRFGPYGSTILGVSAVLLIWIGTTYFIHSEKLQTEHAARENAANLSRVFAEQIVRSIRAVDQTLLYVRDSYARDPDHFGISLWARNSQFLSDFNFQVSIIGKDGLMIASNIPGSEPGVDLSDREHFRVHAERNTDELFISKPLVGRVSNKASIQFTRRITMPDGSFGGVVVVSVDPNYLSQLYGSIDVGQNGIIALIGTDGIVRARGGKGPSAVGRSIAGGPLFQQVARSESGFFVSKSGIDGIERLYAYRKVKGYPLIVTVGLAEDEVFDAYNRNRNSNIAIAVLLTLWLLAVTTLMVRYQRTLARARDAAEAGTRARSEFLAMMSHEIRTPMNGMIGTAELLLDSGLSTEQQTYARTMHESAAHLLRIINDVLDFSKLEADRIEIEKVPFSVHDLVRDTVGLLAVPAKEKGLELTVSIAPDVPDKLIGDPARLRQVLLNLVGNGMKFTHAGTVAVTVARDEDHLPGQVRLTFSVADTGIGIPEAAIPQLFREFSQLDSSIARRFGGTGLGLAICKRLIDLMHGTISVASKVGKGTIFRFSLDYLPSAAGSEVSAAEAAHPSPPLAPEPMNAAPSIRILLVEDNKTNQFVATKLIEGLGYSVDLAGNGVEALAACSSTEYDVVFMDVMMPEMDGLAATSAIRKLPAPFCKPHIIALTAISDKDDKDVCLSAGMDDYLLKPVTRNAIAAKLDAYFALHAEAGSASAAPAPQAAPAGSGNVDLPAAFDGSIYAELAGALGADGIKSVLALFLGDTEQRFTLMREAAKSGECATVKREAHSLKSSAANFGFLRLSQTAKALERDAPGLAGPALDERLDVVAGEFAEIRDLAKTTLLAPAGAGRSRATSQGEAHVE